jgi:hypothetical protein
MATGNLFLGTARKKLGDVVMFRRDGKQQARVRVRNIANPKSVGQCLQRNYMAPVAKFYAPLAGVLERSWEGLNKSKSHNAFTKANVELARANGWYVPKGAGLVCLPYQVSKGIMTPHYYTDSAWNVSQSSSALANLKISTLTQKLADFGHVEGEQVTMLFFIQDETTQDVRPAWLRFILSSTDETDISTLAPQGVELTAGNGVVNVGSANDIIVGFAVIASQWDGSKWLRSSQNVAVYADYLASFTGVEARQAAIDSYGQGAAVISSDIYLNGSDTASGTGSDTAKYFDLYNSNGTAKIGTVRLTEVVAKGSAGSPVLIRGAKGSNGAPIVMEIQDAEPSSPTNGKFLDGSGQFDYATNSWDGCIRYTADEVEMYTWLVMNGITMP